MTEQDRTLNGLRAFRASNPATALPPAIVDDSGGVESSIGHVARSAGMLHPYSLAGVDWRGICGDLRRSVKCVRHRTRVGWPLG